MSTATAHQAIVILDDCGIDRIRVIRRDRHDHSELVDVYSRAELQAVVNQAYTMGVRPIVRQQVL